MKREDFSRCLNEGLEASSLRQLHFVLVKIQVHWIAALGQPRWYFLLITILGLPASVLCFWVNYMTAFTSQDTTDWPLLSVVVWGIVAFPAKFLPLFYALYLTASLITGAFYKEFWDCVERIRAQDEPK